MDDKIQVAEQLYRDGLTLESDGRLTEARSRFQQAEDALASLRGDPTAALDPSKTEALAATALARIAHAIDDEPNQAYADHAVSLWSAVLQAHPQLRESLEFARPILTLARDSFLRGDLSLAQRAVALLSTFQTAYLVRSDDNYPAVLTALGIASLRADLLLQSGDPEGSLDLLRGCIDRSIQMEPFATDLGRQANLWEHQANYISKHLKTSIGLGRDPTSLYELYRRYIGIASSLYGVAMEDDENFHLATKAVMMAVNALQMSEQCGVEAPEHERLVEQIERLVQMQLDRGNTEMQVIAGDIQTALEHARDSD